MSRALLSSYLERPVVQPAPVVLEAIAAGPISAHAALPLADVQRLCDPTPLTTETGWCTLPDGVGYVAVRTPMPHVDAEMVDWWFDWHPREPLRYRVWHPRAHHGNSLQAPVRSAAKPHWGAVHHPVEDVGTGVVHARIEFKAPSQMGMSDDGLDDPNVATIVCGHVGDDRLRLRHTAMFHVFLRADEGVVLRSHFWLGAITRPYGPLGGFGEAVLNRRFVRRRALPRRLPRVLASHCAEEYTNLALLLPQLYAQFGPAGASDE